MRKEAFFEVLGELDDGIIIEAKLTRKKKRNGRAAIAACLCLIAAAVFAIASAPGDPGYPGDRGDCPHMEDPSLDGAPSGYGQSGDLAPMVCVNRALYQAVGNQPDLDGKEDELIYLGEILSKVPSSQKPTEDFQANDEIIGSKVYLYDGENVVVKINGKYWLYEPLYSYQK